MAATAAVFGASGYAGGELVRLLDAHPAIDLVHLGAHSRAGERLAAVHPQLRDGDRILGDNDPEAVEGVDVVFLALPHGASWEAGVLLAARGTVVVDLGSDFRLDTPARYERAYGTPHPVPDQLGSWVYGLPELIDWTGRSLVASPGCYPTATLLAAAPVLAAGLAADGPIVADCLSGVSGAGRSVKEQFLFGSVAEGVRGYGITTHRHRPEIEMGLGLATGRERPVVFTPHLVPMQRGLLATVTIPLAEGVTSTDLRTALDGTYDAAPFVSVVDTPPQTRWVVGSNRALVAGWVDEGPRVAVVQCAIDNLLKGAAGQAVQAANLVLGIEETTGLPIDGWMP